MHVLRALVALASVFVIGTYVQDLQDIIVLGFSAIIGRRQSGCQLCHKIVNVLLKVTELDEAENIDCRKLCFGAERCAEQCNKVVTAMATSEGYPCVAAGLCPVENVDGSVVCQFNFKRLRCQPTSSCVRKFPLRCEVAAGLKTWHRYSHQLKMQAGLITDALKRMPRCGEKDAGPYCVFEPTGLGRACELIAWVLPFLYGSVSSVRAVESPGGDDDRQWLTFWICFFAFLAVERGTSVLLSHLPRYYEVKLAVLCWLMFRRGADSVYRALRRAGVRLAGYVTERSHARLPSGFGEAPYSSAITNRLSTLVKTDDRSFERAPYFKSLPSQLRTGWLELVSAAGAPRRCAHNFDTFLRERCCTESRAVKAAGALGLVELRLLWADQPPRYLKATLVCAAGVPCMRRRGAGEEDEGGGARRSADDPTAELNGTDAYAILSLVPPAQEGKVSREERKTLDALEGVAKRGRQSMRQSMAAGGARKSTLRQSMSRRLSTLNPLAAAPPIEEDDEYSAPVRRARKSIMVSSAAPKPIPEGGGGGGGGQSKWGAPSLYQKIAAHVLTRTISKGPEPPAGSYAHVVSRVVRDTTRPSWRQDFELELRGGVIDADGVFACPDAPFTCLRVELWHRVPWEPDDFMGEVSVPLVHCMDMAPHRGWFALKDPQRKADLPSGEVVCGEVFLELEYTLW